MNVWKCGARGCPHIVVGLAGPVGLRTIGWEVTFGHQAPAIRCPKHYAQAAADQPVSAVELERRLENIRLAALDLQEDLYSELDRLFLKKKSGLRFAPLRSARR